jgi:hypothetical protein
MALGSSLRGGNMLTVSTSERETLTRLWRPFNAALPLALVCAVPAGRGQAQPPA